jgi:cation-transporting ATPase 13A1
MDNLRVKDAPISLCNAGSTLLVKSKSISRVFLVKIKPTWHSFLILPFVVSYSIWIAWALPQLLTVIYKTMEESLSVNNSTINGTIGLGVGISQMEPSFDNSLDTVWIVLCGLIAIHCICGLLSLWYVPFYTFVWYTKLSNNSKLGNADAILVYPTQHRGSPALCEISRTNIGDNEQSISFVFQKKKYIYDNEAQFKKVSWPDSFSPNEQAWSADEYEKHAGWSNKAVLNRAELVYGLNKLDIPMPTFQELFMEQAIAPFFVFQLFCVLLWTLDDYWYHSLFTLFMLFVFEATVVMQRLRNMAELRGMSEPPRTMLVKRCGKWEELSSDCLIPGDLVKLDVNYSQSDSTTNADTSQILVPCDMVMVRGTCIVNEALLSGESTPLRKEVTEAEGGKKVQPILFGGTQLLECSEDLEAVVLKTGFRTAQGKLVRTMFYGEDRITANSQESFGFIGFLLIFALFAAGYVWNWSMHEDPNQSRFKLLVKCLLIITAVVPPELPMELSLAVNASLLALSKLAIFCVEPFRIPLGGKIDVCCFDKTGTLTETQLVVQGCAGLESSLECNPDVSSWPWKTKIVLATCHSLVTLAQNPGVPAGDPLEKAALEYIQWKLGKKGDSVTPNLGSRETSTSVLILKRFAFQSALRRMSVIGQYTVKQGSDTCVFAAAKGAPEIMKPFFSSESNPLPGWYDSVYAKYTEQGARVLALGFKRINSKESWKDLSRSQIESELEFVGFLVMSCPIKQNAFGAIISLLKSHHRVVMITGDHALTAIHVAKELGMVSHFYNTDVAQRTKSAEIHNVLLLDNPGSLEDTIKNAHNQPYCITGPVLDHIMQKYGREYFKTVILRKTVVFARFSPSNKEEILAMFRELGWTTLMCGDGTNDVGALKRAHVGVALLDGTEEDLVRIAEYRVKQRRKEWEKRFGPNRTQSDNASTNGWSRIIAEAQAANSAGMDDDQPPTIRFGDASVAAPFTSKLSSIESVCHLIRQGRCTLVTTVQMYKILALNSLIIAYALSVLHLAGVRQGDFQLTISGMLLASCFLFLSRGKPLHDLSWKRPPSSIFTNYMMVSILGQFAIHLTALISLQQFVTLYEPLKKVAENSEFQPTLMNSAMYILTLMMQVSTFAMNYQGHPFREGLRENRGLLNALLMVGGIAFLCASESIPEFNEWLQLVPFPDDAFRKHLLATMALDLAGCWLIEWLSSMLLGTFKAKWMS